MTTREKLYTELNSMIEQMDKGDVSIFTLSLFPTRVTTLCKMLAREQLPQPINARRGFEAHTDAMREHYEPAGFRQ